MISRLRFHRDINGRIVNSNPIKDTVGNEYHMSIATDLSEGTIKDSSDCVIAQIVGTGNFLEMVQELKNYLADNLDCRFAMNVFGVGAGGVGPGGLLDVNSVVNFLTAGDFAILAKAGITNVTGTTIVGDVGVSPITYASLTGFDLTPAVPGGGNISATSPSVSGLVYAADYSAPTPANLTAAVSAMEAAYTAAAGLTSPTPILNFNAGNLGSQNLPPGIYKFTTGVTIPTDLTLTGSPGGVWVFQIAGTLSLSTSKRILLAGGAMPQNVIWQVAGAVNIQAGADFQGIILAQTSVQLVTNATMTGRILSQTSVALDDNIINAPYEFSVHSPDIQRLRFSPFPTSGQFKLTYGSFSTPFLPYNATAQQMEDALRDFDDLSEICVDGSMLNGFTVSFGGIEFPRVMTVTSSSLTTATNMAFTTQPSSSAPGAIWSTQPIVTIRDASNATITSGPDSTALVTLSLFSGTGVLSGTVSMNAVAGVANFAGKGMSINLAGAKTIRATKASTVGSGGVGVLTVDSSSLIIASPLSAVPLLTSSNYAILSKAGITNVPTSSITGNMGVSPIAATAITGFALSLDGGGTFSTSAQVTGNVYAADYSAPTPANLTQAVLDMEAAYTDAAGRTSPDFTNLGAGNIGGMTLTPGLYKWTTGVTIPTSITLTGDASSVFIFQIAGTLGMTAAQSVLLSGGVLPQNIFWQVSGAVTIGTTVAFKGVILGQTGITLQTGASLSGAILAQTAAALDNNIVVKASAA